MIVSGYRSSFKASLSSVTEHHRHHRVVPSPTTQEKQLLTSRQLASIALSDSVSDRCPLCKCPAVVMTMWDKGIAHRKAQAS